MDTPTIISLLLIFIIISSLIVRIVDEIFGRTTLIEGEVYYKKEETFSSSINDDSGLPIICQNMKSFFLYLKVKEKKRKISVDLQDFNKVINGTYKFSFKEGLVSKKLYYQKILFND
ncbi:MAG: hypothetical protein WDK96_00235 [Candidatus Paceibacterota bacterium]|jgi:hypothetical protein